MSSSVHPVRRPDPTVLDLSPVLVTLTLMPWFLHCTVMISPHVTSILQVGTLRLCKCLVSHQLLPISLVFFIFIFGCVGSSLLHAGFL